MKKILVFALIACAIAGFVLGMTLLPDTIVTQFGTNPTHMPKLLALLLAASLCIGSCVAYLLGKVKSLFAAVIAIAVMILFFIVNL